MSKITIHKSKIPGIEYEVTKISSSYYLRVMHKTSGTPVINFTSAPVKVRTVIKFCEDTFKGLSWDFPEADFTTAHTQAYMIIRKHKFN